jgi:hypothetical protein
VPADRTDAQHRLERTVARLRGCLGELGADERRVLALRAGLGPGAALSRPQVARRLGLGVARVGSIERRGLRRLGALDGASACAAAASTMSSLPLVPPPAFLGVADAASASDVGAGARHGSHPRFGVGGVVAHGGGGGRSGFGALPPIGPHDAATLLIALMLIVSMLLVTLGLLVRRELKRR